MSARLIAWMAGVSVVVYLGLKHYEKMKGAQ